MKSEDKFLRAWEMAERKDFASYIFQYPPMGVWKKGKSSLEISQSWIKTLASHAQAGLYVHIPFCATKCSFCRWLVVEENSEDAYWEYLRDLADEMALWNPIFRSTTITSLYFGGGTPSILSSRQISFLFKQLRRHFSFSSDCQMAFEGNPSSLDPLKLRLLAKSGVSRLTIGVQSLDDSVIRGVRRTQDNSGVESVYRAARRAGIRHINLDLMCGLPGQSAESFFKTLRRILSWQPDMIHISEFAPTAYTTFSQTGRRLASADIARNRDISRLAARCLRGAGYQDIPYDAMGLSAKARNKHLEDTVVHGIPLLGLGTGAVSHATGHLRSVNAPSPATYHRQVSRGLFPVFKAAAMNSLHEQIGWTLNHLWYGSLCENEFLSRFPSGMNPYIKRRLLRLAAKGVLSRPSKEHLKWRVLNSNEGKWPHPFSRSQFQIRKEFFEKEVANALANEAPPTPSVDI